MNLILFDPENRDQLLPLVFTRPVADLRIGILNHKRKMATPHRRKCILSMPKVPFKTFPRLLLPSDNYLVRGDILPAIDFVNAVKALRKDEGLKFRDQIFRHKMCQLFIS